MFIWSVALLIVLIGLFIGRMSRKNVIFGVKIPLPLIKDERIRKVKMIYIICYLSIMLPASSLLLLLFGEESLGMLIFTLFWIIVITILFLVANNKMRKVKEALEMEYKEESETVDKKKVAILWDEKKLKRHLSLAFIPNWVILGVLTIIYVLKYEEIPSEIPMNYDLQGNVTRVVEKSYASVFLILAIALIISLGIYALMRMNISAKKEVGRFTAKEDGANLYIARERLNLVMSAVVLALNLLLLGIPAAAFGWISGGGNMIMIASIVLLVLMMGMFVVYMLTTGFSGDRLKKGSVSNEEKIYFEKTEGQWKGGMIYYNPEDPAIMVEKRMGGGYTFNFGNPRAMAIFFGIIIVTLVIVIASIIFG